MKYQNSYLHGMRNKRMIVYNALGIPDTRETPEEPFNELPYICIEDDVFYRWDVGTQAWVVIGGGGGASIQDILYADALELQATEMLVPGKFYKIIDRGDWGILLKATSTVTFDIRALRYMACPAYYGIADHGDGHTWLGVWKPGLPIEDDALVIWGGKVWKNVDANDVIAPVSETVLDDTDTSWTLIPKNGYSDEYVMKEFPCFYDFDNDWISLQWDQHNNVIGMSKATNDFWIGNAYNPVDITDWNMGSGENKLLTSNRAWGIFNNTTDVILFNDIPGFIRRNNNTGPIFSNTNQGSIYNNKGNTYGISYNSNTDEISGNDVAGDVTLNSNFGPISGNIIGGGDIRHNSCGGSISGNEIPGAIINNCNREGIMLNFNQGDISNNMNNGEINGSSSSISDIKNNMNNGNITSNSGTGGTRSIHNNINNGDIDGGHGADVTDTIVTK